jgi:CheY-like chemotaxis protein
MLILILDDMQHRHDVIGHMLERKGHKIIHAMTYDQAIKLMQEFHFDGMFLDHDLQEFVRGARVERSGTHVAAFIANELPVSHRPKKIVIHSWSETGADRMEELLTGLDIVVEKRPFSSRWI